LKQSTKLGNTTTQRNNKKPKKTIRAAKTTRKKKRKKKKGSKSRDLQTSRRTIRTLAASVVQISKWKAGKPKKQFSTERMVSTGAHNN
jgi:hypothetical protein